MTLFLMILIFIPVSIWAQAGRKKVQEGNVLFNEEKFDEANSKYRDAQLDAPESPVINYNIAGTEYKIGKFEEALENYSKAMSPGLAEGRKPEEEQLLRSRVHYNRGNTYYKLNKYMEAINEYREALKLNPTDEDAKYNLEFVRNKLKNQSQQQNQDQNQQQNKDKMKPSDYAKKLKAQAEALVEQRKYNEAYQLMNQGLQKDQTVSVFQDFINRIKDIVDIEDAS